jgi:hypothetical protein
MERARQIAPYGIKSPGEMSLSRRGIPLTAGPSTFYALSPNAFWGLWFRQKLPKSRKFLVPAHLIVPEALSHQRGDGNEKGHSRLCHMSKDMSGAKDPGECLVSREAIACYRLYAANCIELAEQIGDVDRRIFLLSMARDWLKLAEQADRGGGVALDARSLHGNSSAEPPQGR